MLIDILAIFKDLLFNHEFTTLPTPPVVLIESYFYVKSFCSCLCSSCFRLKKNKLNGASIVLPLITGRINQVLTSFVKGFKNY